MKALEDLPSYAKSTALMQTDEEREAFRELCQDYREAAEEITGRGIIHCEVIAFLVINGWRKTESA